MGCPEASPCIDLSLSDEAVLQRSWIFAPDSNVACGPAGLISPKLLSTTQCVQTPSFGFFVNPGSTVVQSGPVVTLTNPSATRSMLASIAVLFGTRQLTVHGDAEVFVNDHVGVAPAGGLLPGSYPSVNGCSYARHPLWQDPVTIAFAGSPATQWSCPFAINPGAAIDVSWERRMTSLGTGFGNVTLRTTFIFLWGVVV
jgi:hypothetical protein